MTGTKSMELWKKKNIEVAGYRIIDTKTMLLHTSRQLLVAHVHVHPFMYQGEGHAYI